MTDNTALTYEVITYDILGNAQDGFEVNQAFRTGKTIEVSRDTSDRAINRRLGVSGIDWDGDHEVLYGTLRRNGVPALELRVVEKGA